MKTELSERMQTIADMVIEGETAADIGTDHGLIPAYLIQKEICPKVILTDIAEGPLKRAERLFDRKGLEGDFRLGAGLEVIKNAEVSSVIIAGMGGETIIGILEADPEKSHSFKRLILQPRTFAGKLRVWLSENGYRFVDYRLCREKKLINEVMAVEPGDNGGIENELISDHLVKNGDPLLKEYLESRLGNLLGILEQLKKSKTENRELTMRLEIDALYVRSLLEKQ